jgi:16S rRNA (adenine1518-N6/adenine1519-N6)-dimethyltransferase
MPGGFTSEVRAELEALGFRPSRRLGQNFMRDGNMIAALARASGAAAGDLVLEPGPGAGGLTAELLSLGCEVLAVELDRRLAEFLRKRFAGQPGFQLITGDILEKGRRLSREAVAALGGRAFCVCSNLPYSAATPFLVALAASDLAWKAAAVTVQKEVAERLAASPGSGDYGAATVLVAARAEVESVRQVPPSVFWPQPKVWSAVLRLAPLEHPLVTAGEMEGFAELVRALFSARRKTLARALAVAGLAPEQARAAIATAGADPNARPEALAPVQFARLWRATGS